MRSVVVSCPIDTYSGYGARARDLVKALIETKKYDVKIVPMGPHGTDPHKESTKTSPIRIEENSILGARVTLLPGIKVGRDSVIDMNSLITKNIPQGSHIRGPKEIVARMI